MTFTQRIRNFRLPLSVLAGPVAWALQLAIGYMLVPLACRTASPLPLVILSLLAALLTLFMGVVAYRGWQHGSGEPEAQDVDESANLRVFFGSFGALINILFLGMIIATAVYSLFLNPCPLITQPFP